VILDELCDAGDRRKANARRVIDGQDEVLLYRVALKVVDHHSITTEQLAIEMPPVRPVNLVIRQK